MRFERTRRRRLAATLALLAPMLGLGLVIPAHANEVLIYSARHYGQEPAFEAFTKKTGIQIKMLSGSTGEMFERLKAKQDDINIASAGEFQAAATRLADRVGYK